MLSSSRGGGTVDAPATRALQKQRAFSVTAKMCFLAGQSVAIKAISKDLPLKDAFCQRSADTDALSTACHLCISFLTESLFVQRQTRGKTNHLHTPPPPPAPPTYARLERKKSERRHFMMGKQTINQVNHQPGNVKAWVFIILKWR